MENITENILAAVVFVGLFAGSLVEAIKRSNLINDQLLPFVSMGVGMATGFALAIGFDQDIATFVAAGFIGGSVASGVYDGVKTLFDMFGGNK